MIKMEESDKAWQQLSNVAINPDDDRMKLAESTLSGKATFSMSGTVKPLSKESLVMALLLLVLAFLTIYALLTMDYQSVDIPKAIAATVSNFKIIFTQPNFKRLNLWEVFSEVGMTLGLAFLTTVFSGLISLVLGLLAARNLAPKQVTNIIKGMVAFIRAIPTILWVLIFAVAAGLGSTAAVIGLIFHSVSYLTKAYSESFEVLDKSVIEALKASGAKLVANCLSGGNTIIGNLFAFLDFFTL